MRAKPPLADLRYNPAPMSVLEILLLAAGLAMDASAVSLGAGASGRAAGFRPTFRLAFHFGLFQFLMPVLGWLAGAQLAGALTAVDHWVAFALLAFVGGRMIRAGLAPADAPRPGDPSRGWTLVALSLATSVDALAVGLSLAMVGIRILLPSVVIGVVTAAMSAVAVQLGNRLGARFGRGMDVVGGLILLAIGARIVFVHTLG
jgi:manganese efflux pump family protein